MRNLRNNITHYVPDFENKKIQIMVAGLKNKHFQLNNLIGNKSIYTFFLISASVIAVLNGLIIHVLIL